MILYLKSIIESKGGFAEVAKKTDIDPQTLSDVLTNKEALHIDTLTVVLNAIGCRLSIVSLDGVEIDSEAPIEIPSNPQSIMANYDNQ